MILCVCLCPGVGLFSRDPQCVCSPWRMCAWCSMDPLLTKRDQTTSGSPTQEKYHIPEQGQRRGIHRQQPTHTHTHTHTPTQHSVSFHTSAQMQYDSNKLDSCSVITVCV